ncbi:MAG: response regulator transcription factor [Thermodesulfobacteriota bacterium]
MATILVIDDEETIRSLLDTVLTGAGHTVLVASDGAAGLALCRRSQADLIITDIVMPDIDGLELITQIRQERPAATIVAMSGGGLVSPHDYLQLARTLGAAAALAKPFSRRELMETINPLLGDQSTPPQ